MGIFISKNDQVSFFYKGFDPLSLRVEVLGVCIYIKKQFVNALCKQKKKKKKKKTMLELQ